MFAAVTNEASEIAVVHERSRHSVVVGPRPGLAPWPRVYADMALASYLCLGRRWVGGDVVPTAVAFQHSRPDDISEYERLFRCTPQFSATKNRLVFEEATLALPLGTTDPEMLAYFEGKAQVALEVAQSATLEQRVRAAIDRVLGVRPPTLAHVARLLATSARTLQRRLAIEQLSFAALVDEVRRVRALQLLATRDVDLGTIAARTGYRDIGAFRAAVQRWTGQSPRDLRK
jgi:AraC-like DNA-binding protein